MMTGALRSDLRYALRSLRRAPGFVAVAVVTLSLGIGGVTAMYTLVYGALLRPLTYDRAGELLVLKTRRGEEVFPALSMPDMMDLRSASRELADIAVWKSWRVTIESPAGEARRVTAASIDSRYFAMLGASMAVGRPFGPADDVAGHEPVVILSHAYWQSAHGGDPAVVGTTIDLDGNLYRVVGVASAGLRDPLAASFAFINPPLWRASPPEFENTNRSWRAFWGLARLAPGSTLERVRTELDAVAAGLREAWPRTNAELGMGAVSLREHLVGANRQTLVVLSLAVLLVLFVACANVANLLLTRGTSRADEHAVRRALGAGRLRIVRPLVMEHALLAVAGLAGGFAAAVAIAAVSRRWTSDLAALVEIRMDVPVLLGAAALSLAVAMTFGLIPAWQAVGPEGPSAGSSRTIGGRGARLRSGLVITETALAVTLLLGAGLLVESYRRMSAVDLGIGVDGALVATITPSTTRYATPASLDEVTADIVARAQGLPGVRAAGLISDLPLTGVANSGWITRPDRPLAPGEAPPSALYRTVAGAYFRAAGMRLVAGRPFDDRDAAGAPLTSLINERAAAQLFPDENPLGMSVQIMGQVREVVGVVNSVREYGPAAPPPMVVYVPFRQEGQEWATRTTSLMVDVGSEDPADHMGLLRQAVMAVDPTTAVNDLRPMSDVAALTTRAARYRTAVLTAFAAVAMTLAAVGLAGVVGFQAASRRRELGLRMALGATEGGVVGLLVGRGLRLSAMGAAAGLVCVAILGRWIAHLLYGVGPLDPTVFVAVPAGFLAVAALAAFIPAFRASRLQPAVALRDE